MITKLRWQKMSSRPNNCPRIRMCHSDCPIPSLAPEGIPAGEDGIVREEVIGIHRALREVLRQLQKNPPRQRQPTVVKP